MNKFWSRRLEGMTPYTPGEQPKDRKFIKLNTNENPYPPSPKALEAAKSAASADLRLYPDPEGMELKRALSEFYGAGEKEIFLGNGSDEILAFCFPAFFNAGEPVVFADITYSFYPVYANMFGIDYRLIPVNDDFTQPVEKYREPNGGVLIANPNAPTGLALPLEKIEEIVRANSEKVVIVDEAYVDFGAQSAVGLIGKYPNLLVVQTASKSRSLAGMRVGFAFGNPGLIEALELVKNSMNSYTLDRVAIAAASAAVRDREYFRDCCRKITDTREKTAAELEKLGFSSPVSSSNFIFITHEKLPAREIFSALREKGILVRYFDKPRIDNYLRVSIGSGPEMEAFVQAMKEIVG